MDKVTLPKPKQIRLPFHVSHVNKTPQAQRTCQICRKNPSPYACPRCNIPYCSLECYQSPSKHSQCSEPFFKEEIHNEIGTQKNRTQEEKNKMWELLRKFEDGVGQEGILDLDKEGLGDDNDDDHDEDDPDLQQLQDALEGIDIDSLSPEALLELLPAHLREQFLSSLDTPEPSALLQSLLDSDELALQADTPWWLPTEDDVDSDPSGFISSPKGKRRGPPSMMTLPKEVLLMGISEEMGERMVYNVLAVAQAYVHTTLLFQKSPLASSASTSPSVAKSDESEPFTHDPILINLLSLVPFLSDPTSKTLFTSLSQTLVSLRSHAPPDDPLASLPATLLAPLLLPPIDLSLPHPLSLLLSDLDALLVHAQSSEPDAKRKKEVGKTRKKVGFLAGCVSQVGRKRWMEVMADVGKVFAEKEEEEDGGGEGAEGIDVGKQRRWAEEGGLVEEVDGAGPGEKQRIADGATPPKFEEIVEDEDDFSEGQDGARSDLVDLESRVGLSEKMSGKAGGMGRIVELPGQI